MTQTNLRSDSQCYKGGFSCTILHDGVCDSRLYLAFGALQLNSTHLPETMR